MLGARSARWLKAQARDGVIPARKIQGRWRFTDIDIARAIDIFDARTQFGITPTDGSRWPT